MNNSRIVFLPILITLLLSLVFALSEPGSVLGQMTIPTRTPVPPDPLPQPTDDEGGSDQGGGGQPSPSDTPSLDTPLPPTSTPDTVQSPTSTSTAVTLPTATNTTAPPIDEIAPGTTPITFPQAATPFPTALPGGEPPTITTLTIANVYDGPGTDYLFSQTIMANEVRPIVGRAAAWWLIQLDADFNQAWISEKSGTIQGFTGNVPVIEVPTIKGATPAAGADQSDPTPAPTTPLTPSPTPAGVATIGSISGGSGSSSEIANTTPTIDVAAGQDSQSAEAGSNTELEAPAITPTPTLFCRLLGWLSSFRPFSLPDSCAEV